MRHPIIERVSQTVFVPNDIHLGGDHPTGALIYGVNSSGKSIYLKSVCIAVILAQIGMFVPAKSFTFYPFERIITKISMKDDMYKNRSTFECEMHDLMQMLTYKGPRILICADELCSGTSTDDAIGLVSSAIKELTTAKANFIFTTHLHQLNSIPLVTDLSDQVTFNHMAVSLTNDASAGAEFTKYERKLLPGSGSSSYGIEIAQKLKVGSSNFIKNAISVRKSLNPFARLTLVTTKASRYNKDVYVTACELCGARENLETHHIIPQVDADENGMLPDGRHKNDKTNLQVLCEVCHSKIPTHRK